MYKDLQKVLSLIGSCRFMSSLFYQNTGSTGGSIVSECRLSKCPEQGLKTILFKPEHPVIQTNRADPGQMPRSAA